MDDYLPIPKTCSLAKYEGNKVVIKGRVSHMPWQHMIQPLDSHPDISYVDVSNDQIVVYSKRPLPSEGNLEIRGTVTRLVGTSKRPGSDEVYSEIQLVADGWSRCE